MKLLGVILIAVAFKLSTISSDLDLNRSWNWIVLDNAEKVAEKVTMVFTPDTSSAVFLPLRDLQYITTHSAFDKKKKTVIYIHGWLESGRLDLSVLSVRGAYIDRGDHNVISVDWSHYSKNIHYHVRVIPQMKVIAETIAECIREFINSGYPISDLHLVGHSLGGQMVGKIGRHLRTITKGSLIVPKIFALDPAGPGFEDHSIDGFEPISQTDGDYVQIIHTCGGRFGMQHRCGNADFYPDGGQRHPGCDDDVTSSLIDSYEFVCDHARSWHFYQLSVRNPISFPAIRCVSWDDFLANSKEACFKDDIAYMGFGALPSQTGKYYLQTNGNMFNLSRRTDGTRYTKVNLTNLMVPGEKYTPEIPVEVQEQIMF